MELPLQSLIIEDKDTREDSSEDDVPKIENKNLNKDTDNQTLHEEEMDINDDAETELNQQLPSTNPRRGPGRSKIIRTSQRGRPKKEYQVANIAEMETDPLTVEEAMSSVHRNKWLEAMQSEYDSLMECGTWELIDLPQGKKAISCKWVFHTKRCQNGEVEKFSRLDWWLADANNDTE